MEGATTPAGLAKLMMMMTMTLTFTLSLPARSGLRKLGTDTFQIGLLVIRIIFQLLLFVTDDVDIVSDADVCCRFRGSNDVLVTPFAQLLNSLRHIRSNIITLADVAPSRFHLSIN